MNPEVPSVYDAQAGLIEALAHEAGLSRDQARVISSRIKDLIEAVVFEGDESL